MEFTNINLTGRQGYQIFAPNQSYIGDLKVYNLIRSHDQSNHVVFATNGSIANIGTEESFVFTLEDGSTITKSIRVISTTSQAGA